MIMYLSLVRMLHATIIVAISLTTGVSAAILDSSISPASSQLSSSSSSSPRVNQILSADEMILFGEGRIEVVSNANYSKYLEGVNLEPAEQHHLNFTAVEDQESTRKVNKRCQSHSVFMMNPIEQYISWDVSMSGVIRAPPNSSATLSVGPGYWISNSLSVSLPTSLDIVKDFLSSTVGFSYGKSWTTTYSTGYSFSIPAGKYAAVVSNPVAIRHSGYMDSGCIGSSKRTEFSGESFQSKSYSGITWVDGIIRLCSGDTYPLPRCFGKGTL